MKLKDLSGVVDSDDKLGYSRLAFKDDSLAKYMEIK
jgi:hypothetical protein